MSALIRLQFPLYRTVYMTSRAFCTPEIPRNILEDLQSSQHQSKPGVVYDKKPFRIDLIGGKKYAWCFCGKSKSQPFCDGTHKYVHFKIEQKPIRFAVEKSGTYYLCNCKQTKNRPFCDGTHKTLT